jgi:hypothetical protein
VTVAYSLRESGAAVAQREIGDVRRCGPHVPDAKLRRVPGQPKPPIVDPGVVASG